MNTLSANQTVPISFSEYHNLLFSRIDYYQKVIAGLNTTDPLHSIVATLITNLQHTTALIVGMIQEHGDLDYHEFFVNQKMILAPVSNITINK